MTPVLLKGAVWGYAAICDSSSFNLAQMMEFVFDRVKNIVGKGEITGNQHFLLFPQCFLKASFLGSSNDCMMLNFNFEQYFSYIMVASAPIHAFLEFF